MAQIIGEELRKIKENLKIDIKALLCSSKDGLTERELKKQYMDLNGTDLPYAKIGYRNMYDMMRDMPETVSIRKHWKGNTWIYFGKHDESTIALGLLVHGQKDTKKGIREKNRCNEGNRYSNSYNGSYGGYNAGYTYRQSNNFNNNFNNNTQKEIVSSHYAVPALVQGHIESILKNAPNFKMSSNEFFNQYVFKHGFLFGYKSMGFSTPRESLESLKHLILIEPDPNDEKEFYISLIVSKNNNTTSQLTSSKVEVIKEPTEACKKSLTNTTSSVSSISNNNVNIESKANDTSVFSKRSDSNNKISTDINNNQVNSSEKISKDISPCSSTYLTCKEEIIKELINLIESRGSEGIYLSSILKSYKNLYEKSLDYEKLGYNSLAELVYDPLVNRQVLIKFDDKLVTGNNMILYKKKSDKLDSTSANEYVEPKLSEEKRKDLIDKILRAFKDQRNFMFINQFYIDYKANNGEPLNAKDYGFPTLDKLMLYLNANRIIELRHEESNPSLRIVRCISGTKSTFLNSSTSTFNGYKSLTRKKSSTHDSSRSRSSVKEEEQENERIKNDQAEFIQDYVMYNQDFDQSELMKQIATKGTHKIVVSNIINPLDIQIILTENYLGLDKLMDDLDECYNGIGASNFDMPLNYVHHGRVCAAVYPNDKNWHRCRIISVAIDKMKAGVGFVDYGGECQVPIDSLKFLNKNFGKMPPQAINAKFANLKCPNDNNKWDDDIVNYLLNHLMNKDLEANIIGINDKKVSLEIFRIEKDKKIDLGNLLIKEGRAKYHDEKKDTDFISFENWQQTMEKPANNHNEAYNHIDLIDDIRNFNLDDPQKIIAYKNRHSSPKCTQFDKNNYISNTQYNHTLNNKSFHKIKSKKIDLEFDSGYPMNVNLNLLSIDDTTYVHLTEISVLLNFTYIAILALIKECGESDYLIKYEYNELNYDIFFVTEELLGEDLSIVNEDGVRELEFFPYKKLVKFCELVLINPRLKIIKDVLNKRSILSKKSKQTLKNT